jgi:hypothetical protein
MILLLLLLLLLVHDSQSSSSNAQMLPFLTELIAAKTNPECVMVLHGFDSPSARSISLSSEKPVLNAKDLSEGQVGEWSNFLQSNAKCAIAIVHLAPAVNLTMMERVLDKVTSRELILILDDDRDLIEILARNFTQRTMIAKSQRGKDEGKDGYLKAR